MSEGWQVELPEDWLAHGNPWEFERRESAYEIGFGGHVEPMHGAGRVAAATSGGPASICWRWPSIRRSSAGAAARVNTLRLW